MNPKHINSLVAGFISATFPLTVPALLLDCEINPDKTYTCVEISPTDVPDISREQAPKREDHRRYIEQAKKSCVYREPRKRISNKGGGSALRTEELKSARKDYEKCISEKAWELWHQNNNPGQSAN